MASTAAQTFCIALRTVSPEKVTLIVPQETPVVPLTHAIPEAVIAAVKHWEAVPVVVPSATVGVFSRARAPAQVSYTVSVLASSVMT